MRLVLLLVLASVGYGQAQYSLEGTVTSSTGEKLIMASVFLKNSPYASVTDDKGVFLLENIDAGTYELKVTYLGYENFDKEIEISSDLNIDIVLTGSKYNLDAIEILANELEKSSPFAYSEISDKEIANKNLAQDLPVLLEHQTSMVVTSDAGSGVGYTSMRLRGSDATRINVTVNGVPLNDSESHSVFWVNMPDFASSVNSIQLQRGVGPSTNGSAAFGGSLSLNTQQIRQNALISLNGSYGSFNTKKISFSATTGLINEQFTIEGRYSKITSDGYVDRASSDLTSYFFSVSKIGEKSSFRFNLISGSERTYQSWWGVPEARLTGDEEALRTHYFNNIGSIYNTNSDSINLFGSDRKYNYYQYDNQVDDYKQDHYQFIYGQKINDRWNTNLTLHYTRGKGFFEEFRYNDAFVNYRLGPFEDDNSEAILSSDLVRRRWLDNHFYGAIFNSSYELNANVNLVTGVSANRYDGDHFGNVIYSERVQIENPDFRYYDSDSDKRDYNAYVKLNYKLRDNVLLFGDIQSRYISYQTSGTDNDLLEIDVDTSYNFINPKFGITYLFNEQSSFYASASKAQREPVRSDFTDAIGISVPQHESMWDYEVGWRYQSPKLTLSSNLYSMQYSNQLVLTGAVNDVGAPVRTNVDKSYRLGIEIESGLKLNDHLNWQANLSLSRNKINNFAEIILDYDNGGMVVNEFKHTDISFSPNIIGGSMFEYLLNDHLTVKLLTKYVGKQFLDNTSNTQKYIDAYVVNDMIFVYSPKIKGVNKMEIKLLVNNMLDHRYASNGYTYSYIFGGLIEENFYYPQAGINFLLGANFQF